MLRCQELSGQKRRNHPRISKERKRLYEVERAAKTWVLGFTDTYIFDELVIVSATMPYDKALCALEKDRKEEGRNDLDHLELRQVPIIGDPIG